MINLDTMKDCNLDDYLFYDGQLVRCVGVNEGNKEVVLETLEDARCPHCSGSLGKRRIYVNVESPNFQAAAQPIKTIWTPKTL